jgi:UDP-N-acetylmuramoyl-tripeptide--D-alanyl-D-alanine ligase
MIATLASVPARRRILIAGEMLELGSEGVALHQQAGTVAGESGIDVVVGVRGNAEYLAQAAREAGATAIFVASPLEAGEWLKANLREGDTVLLKASRGVGLEKAIQAITS